MASTNLIGLASEVLARNRALYFGLAAMVILPICMAVAYLPVHRSKNWILARSCAPNSFIPPKNPAGKKSSRGTGRTRT